VARPLLRVIGGFKKQKKTVYVERAFMERGWKKPVSPNKPTKTGEQRRLLGGEACFLSKVTVPTWKMLVCSFLPVEDPRQARNSKKETSPLQKGLCHS